MNLETPLTHDDLMNPVTQITDKYLLIPATEVADNHMVNPATQLSGESEIDIVAVNDVVNRTINISYVELWQRLYYNLII